MLRTATFCTGVAANVVPVLSVYFLAPFVACVLRCTVHQSGEESTPAGSGEATQVASPPLPPASGFTTAQQMLATKAAEPGQWGRVQGSRSFVQCQGQTYWLWDLGMLGECCIMVNCIGTCIILLVDIFPWKIIQLFVNVLTWSLMVVYIIIWHWNGACW